MIDGQLNIFDVLYPKFKVDKPIRLIELFGGYGSQALALKYLGVEFEHWKLVEWAVKSIQAYKDIHFSNQFVEVMDIPKEDIIEFLYKKGISQNYNEPMTLEQIKRLSDEKLYTIYENIAITNNLVNIQQVKGEDLEIEETDKYCYIMTYSFPCQDLSLAGKGKGMSDTSTRSGILWEVERILNECKEKPQVLLMENVIQVHCEDNLSDFNKWKDRLEEMGYKNYFQDLIATDYGIPQTRNRCFMVSILGEYSYTFPKSIPLKLKLKDMLEDKVDNKYFLSEEMMKEIEISETTGEKLFIKNATLKGYLEAREGDGININSRMEYHRGNVQKNKIQTLTTISDRGVVVKPKVIGGFGKIGSTNQFHQQNRIYDDNVSIAITTSFNPFYKNELKIRKLTPKECFRLMGVKDEDYDRCAKNQNDSSLYHLAGDSIVVNVLMAIFKEML